MEYFLIIITLSNIVTIQNTATPVVRGREGGGGGREGGGRERGGGREEGEGGRKGREGEGGEGGREGESLFTHSYSK